MQDLSLHILDIVENSVRAQARNIWINIELNIMRNSLIIRIKDDGTGMDQDTLVKVHDPFYTTKTERVKKVGLGIPLFKQNAENSQGNFRITSELGKGTEITAEFRYDHIDRLPLGKISDTLLAGIIGHPNTDYFIHLKRIKLDGEVLEFIFSTPDIKDVLGVVPLTYPDVIDYLEDVIQSGIKKIKMEEYQ
ncbi:MAG: sensor histidine kinase [Candidatus Cloacimonetes bacterium]|nr:sensor histidine kinase [Candidatus Cloacimonadota bacterium]